MRTAICTINDRIYEAAGFEQDRHFENIKSAMICPECKAPAFFRGVTQNGREACFGARHEDGCTMATGEYDETQENNEPVNQRIVVDFNHDSTANGSLSCLLRSLIDLGEFSSSTDLIEIPGQGEFVIADFFVNFKDVTDEHIGTYRGYWGIVPDVRVSGNTMWLNAGGLNTPCANLDEEHFQTVYQRFNIQTAAEMSSSHVLVFGELKVSKSKNKKFVLITDPDNFTMIKP